jgi:hypothetical protein
MMKRGHPAAIIAGIVAVVAACWLVLSNSLEPKSRIRWLLYSSSYKANVLAKHDARYSSMRHIEWDGWGGFGSDTTAYLVFDPADSLAPLARAGQPGVNKGIPCEVWEARRLEEHWYYVVFYTNTSWDGDACKN